MNKKCICITNISPPKLTLTNNYLKKWPNGKWTQKKNHNEGIIATQETLNVDTWGCALFSELFFKKKSENTKYSNNLLSL